MATWDEWISGRNGTYFAQILQVVSTFGCPSRALHAQKFDEKGQKTTECKQESHSRAKRYQVSEPWDRSNERCSG